ncbi:MAG: hypothetical protein P4L16_00405 [Chlamydiales bacterium]|nr:hypothetical protein [Chlamydiales bacterium]
MRIKVVAPFRPFSHDPGVKTVLLGSNLIVQIFPSLIIFNSTEIFVPLNGPCKDFTVLNDLESGKISVSGKTKSGLFRYSLYVQDGSYIAFRIERDALKAISEALSKLSFIQKVDDKLFLMPFTSEFIKKTALERLSFGSHKKQDMFLVRRRKDLREILPLLFMMGQWITLEYPVDKQETLLGVLEESVQKSTRDALEEPFLDFFCASFSGILAPRIVDEEYQGFAVPPIKSGSPLILLKEVMKLIRLLFIKETGFILHIFPKLPSSLHCGRMINVMVFDGAIRMSFEWTKSKLFKVIIRGVKKIEFTLHLPSEIKTFRLRKTLKEKGVTLNRNTPLTIDEGDMLFLDRFLH